MTSPVKDNAGGWLRDDEGNYLKRCWILLIYPPAAWLERVADEREFAPRRQPSTMNADQIKEAVARTLCPPSRQDDVGVAVNYRQNEACQPSCVAVLYYRKPVSWWQVKATSYGANIKEARGSAASLIRYLETGGEGYTAIGDVVYRGVPIGDNLSLTNPEG